MSASDDILDRLRTFAKRDRSPEARVAELLVEAAATIEQLRNEVRFRAFLDQTDADQVDGRTAIPDIVPGSSGYELRMCAPSLVSLCDRLDLIAARRHWAGRILNSSTKGRVERVEDQLNRVPEYVAARVIETLYPHAMPSLEALAEEEPETDGP